jgi:GNAT superfamily N-acetyltransferase
MNIRQAVPEDAKFILSLLAQLGYPDFSEADAREKIEVYTKPGYRMLVSVDRGGNVVGFIALHWFELAHWKGMMGRITAFCIDEKIRGQGFGQQLLLAGEIILREQGAIKIEVTSNARRADAHRFYLNGGYVEDSKRFVKYY